MERVVVVGGAFDPLHIGHVKHIREAKKLGDKLIAMLNPDDHLIKKKGYFFMPYEDRKELVEALRWVDEVVPVIDEDGTVAKTLEKLKPDIYAKGGDRVESTMPKNELETCRKLGIKIVYGVGGGKTRSSSLLVERIRGRVREIEVCRSCGSSKLTPILSLGEIYISDFVYDVPRRPKVPLELVLCEDCHLLQLKHTTNPELLYREYWYKSSVNPIMVKALKDITLKAERLIGLKPGDLVLDIGSNDSTLLRSYKTKGLKLVGFEPATNLMNEARFFFDTDIEIKSKDLSTLHIINDFFTYDAFKEHFGDEKAKVITAIAMFYDLDYPNNFLSDVRLCLDKDGVFIIEQRYLPSMLEQNDIGNICHEHLTYYSLLSLKPLLDRNGLEVFDVELNEVNGGSFRTYVKHKGSDIEPFKNADNRLLALQTYEQEIGLKTTRPYYEFAYEIEATKSKVCDFIKREHSKGKVIHVYAASTKGNTLLQYLGLDHRFLEAAAERDPRKWGKKTVGTWIPIISEEESRKRADYFLVSIWHFREGVLEREREFLKRGGGLIFPFPEFEVIGGV